MPRQSGNSVRGRTGFSKSWGLRASVSFSPFPSPVTHFFALAPIFARLKNEKCLERAKNLTETLATQAKVQPEVKLPGIASIPPKNYTTHKKTSKGVQVGIFRNCVLSLFELDRETNKSYTENVT